MNPNVLVVERTENGVDLAFVEGNRLEGFVRQDDQLITGRIFKSRVGAIERSLDGAFLRIGDAEEKTAFIQGRDLKRVVKTDKNQKRHSIERLVQEGQNLIVQGTREAVGDKGPRVTGKIRIQGRFLTLSPFDEHHALSPRIKGHIRDEWLGRLKNLRPVGGLIARRLAIHASMDDLKAESTELERFWNKLKESKDKPGFMGGFLDPIDAALWQALDWPIEYIAVSDAGISARLKRILERCPDAFEIELVEGHSTFEATGVADEIAIAARPEVPLDPSGRILIEQTAACVAIDVDGGGMNALDANLLAAQEIARQCRLRNLGGNIIIDFIDMPTKPQIKRLEEALRKSFKSDPMPVQILPLSPLGICQISRAKRGGSPIEALMKTCPTCAGEGVLGI